MVTNSILYTLRNDYCLLGLAQACGRQADWHRWTIGSRCSPLPREIWIWTTPYSKVPKLTSIIEGTTRYLLFFHPLFNHIAPWKQWTYSQLTCPPIGIPKNGNTISTAMKPRQEWIHQLLVCPPTQRIRDTSSTIAREGKAWMITIAYEDFCKACLCCNFVTSTKFVSPVSIRSKSLPKLGKESSRIQSLVFKIFHKKD